MKYRIEYGFVVPNAYPLDASTSEGQGAVKIDA